MSTDVSPVIAAPCVWMCVLSQDSCGKLPGVACKFSATGRILSTLLNHNLDQLQSLSFLSLALLLHFQVLGSHTQARRLITSSVQLYSAFSTYRSQICKILIWFEYVYHCYAFLSEQNIESFRFPTYQQAHAPAYFVGQCMPCQWHCSKSTLLYGTQPYQAQTAPVECRLRGTTHGSRASCLLDLSKGCFKNTVKMFSQTVFNGEDSFSCAKCLQIAHHLFRKIHLIWQPHFNELTSYASSKSDSSSCLVLPRRESPSSPLGLKCPSLLQQFIRIINPSSCEVGSLF